MKIEINVLQYTFSLQTDVNTLLYVSSLKKNKINRFSTQVEKCIPMGIGEHNCQSSDHPSKEPHSKTVYIKPNHFHLKHWNTCSSFI